MAEPYSWRVDIYLIDNYTGGSRRHFYQSGIKVNSSSSYSVSVTIGYADPTRTGYNFLGYTKNSNGTGTVIHKNDTVSVSFSGSQTKSLDLYAKWQIQTYTVSYNANGGSGAPSSQTKTYGTNLTLSSTRPTRANYIFQGWATSSTGSVAYQPGGTYSTNASVTLYAIWKVAAATLSSVSNTEVEGSGTASWTKVNTTDAYKLKISFGSAPQVTVNVAANSASCSFTIPATWYSYIVNATSGTATAVLETYTNANYTTLVGSTSKTFTVSVPSSVKPSIPVFTAVPHSANATVEGWGVGVQGYSYFSLDVTATPGTGASISSIAFSGPSISQSGAATSRNTGIVTTTGTITFTVTVTDSRGRTATKTVNAVVYEYSNPVVSAMTAVRCFSDGTASDTEGDYIKAFPVFVFSSVNGNNSLSVKKIEYREHGVGSWTVVTTAAVSGSWSAVFGPADITKAFDVKLTVTDVVGNTYALETVAQSVTGYGFGLKNDRVRFGGPVQKAGFQCDFDSEFNGTVDITPRRCSATLSSAGWYRVLKTVDAPGEVFKFEICRLYSSSNNETHTIDYHMDYGGKNYFLNETSVSGNLYIDKIRCTYDNNGNAYIDIHYNTSTSSRVYVHFSAEGVRSVNENTVAMGLASVADAPAGETVVTTYTFAANTDDSGTFSVGSDANDIVVSGTKLYKHGKIVTGFLKVDTKSISAGGWRNMAVIPSGFRPPYDIDFAGINNSEDTFVHARIFASSGNISIWPTSAIASGKYIYISFTYHTDE